MSILDVWIFQFFNFVIYDSAKLHALRALVYPVPRALGGLLPHVPRILGALVLYVPPVLHALVPHITCVLCVLLYVPRAKRTLVSRVSHVLLNLACLVPCVFPSSSRQEFYVLLCSSSLNCFKCFKPNMLFCI